MTSEQAKSVYGGFQSYNDGNTEIDSNLLSGEMEKAAKVLPGANAGILQATSMADEGQEVAAPEPAVSPAVLVSPTFPKRQLTSTFSLPKGFVPSIKRPFKANFRSSGMTASIATESGFDLGSQEIEKPGLRDRMTSLTSSFTSFFARRSTDRTSSTIKVAPKKPARVEPKSYFANERTFIQWISAGLLLVTISAILMDYQIRNNYPLTTGLALVCCALTIVIYATFMYYRRTYLLSTGSLYGYIDYIGPILLSIAVFAGAIVLLLYDLEERGVLSPLFGGKLLQQSGTECYSHSMEGMSLLEYQPSDVYVDSARDLLVIPSMDRITAVPRSAGVADQGVKILAEIPGADLEGITYVNDRVFAICERGSTSELIELEWVVGESNDGHSLNVVHIWEIGTQKVEGIAYVPPTSPGRGPGQLYVAGLIADPLTATENGQIDIYEVPPKGSNSTLLDSKPLNQNMLHKGLIDSKIGSLYYFDNVLFVLHDNDQVVRAWNIQEGTLLAHWDLPRVGDGFDKQWEGMALESPRATQINSLQYSDQIDNQDADKLDYQDASKISHQEVSESEIPAAAQNKKNEIKTVSNDQTQDDDERRGLRGSPTVGNSSEQKELILHLTLDSPAQIWTLRVQKGSTNGEIILPGCAAL